jgi:hypothetical protein
VKINYFCSYKRKYMRGLLISIAILIAAYSYSQEILPTNRDEVIKTIQQLALENISRINPENLSFGFSFSPSISWLTTDNQELFTDGATISGTLAFHLAYKMTNNISLASGAFLGIQGGYLFDDESMKDLTTKNNFLQNYYTIEFPVLARYNMKPVNKITYYAQGGLVPGFSIAATEFHQKSTWANRNKRVNITTLSDPFILSFQMGIGTSRKIWKKNAVFAEINFKTTMINLASEDGYLNAARYTNVPEIHGGNMFFTFGLNF